MKRLTQWNKAVPTCRRIGDVAEAATVLAAKTATSHGDAGPIRP